jgi:hypothetical protein
MELPSHLGRSEPMPLSKRQRDELEDAALKAFAGTLSTLANGFRIQTGA